MPTLADLDAAMLRPGRSVPAIRRLGGGTVGLAGTGQPWRVVGRSAAVYQLRHPSGRILALRCPLADPPELDPALGDRYRALAADPALAPLRGAGLLAADVVFVPDGIAVAAPDFRSVLRPLIAMEWIPEPTLLAAVDRAGRAGDRSTLTALAEAWAALLVELARVGFSHGDLAADNALVRPGGIVLIDYDTCAWPGAPRPAGRPGAVAGTPGYAHPSGAPLPVGRRDDFPALVIYASLRVLARWPELRREYGDPAGRTGGALLFAERDLQAPDASPLFTNLRALEDPPVRRLLTVLRAACRAPATDVPRFVDLLAEVRDPAAGGVGAWPHVSAADPVWHPSGPRGAQSRPPTAPTPDGWRSAGLGATTGPAATGSAAGIAGIEEGGDALERQRRLTRLNSLLLAGDEEGAERFWAESGLALDPEAARELGPRIAEIGRRRLLRRAREAVEAGDSAALLRLWGEGRLDDYPPAAPLRPLIEAARRRSGGVERLRAALDVRDAQTVLAIWPELRGDPQAAPLAVRVYTLLAEAVGAAVARAIRSGNDAAIVAAVRAAEQRGVAVDVEARRAARAAAGRIETERSLRAAAAVDDRATLAALALSGRLEELGRLEPGLTRAVERAFAWPHLERALDADDDAAILAAFDPDLFGDPGALSPEQRTRIELARARTTWLAETRAALKRRDAAALRAALTKPPPGAEARLTRVERARLQRLTARDEAVERLARALREGPDTAIVAALSGVEAAGAPLPDALDWAAIRGVVDRLSLADAIREAAAADPLDYARLARLLPVARAAMAEGAGLGDRIDFAKLEQDMLRAAHLARLREALLADDDAAIAAAAVPDPYGVLTRLTDDQRARVRRALQQQHRAAPALRTR